MSRKLIIRPEAEADLSEAFEWYETRVTGLRLEFIRTVDSLFNSIIRNPQAYPVVYKTARRALTRKFPYEVFFLVDADRVIVVAIFHARRSPQRWQERI
jgi:plasmid stabilization system protein ParE